MYIDTNYLLRFLLNDIHEQAYQAAQTIADGAEIYPEVVPEAVYVLTKIYKLNRNTVSSTLISLLDDISVERPEQIKEALRLYGETNLDYVDCLHLAGLSMYGNNFATFDQKLIKKRDASQSYYLPGRNALKAQ